MSRRNPAQADVLDLFRQEAEAQAQVLTAGLLALERTQTAPDPHHAHVDPSGSRDARAERFRISVCAPPSIRRTARFQSPSVSGWRRRVVWQMARRSCDARTKHSTGRNMREETGLKFSSSPADRALDAQPVRLRRP